MEMSRKVENVDKTCQLIVIEWNFTKVSISVLFHSMAMSSKGNRIWKTWIERSGWKMYGR